MVETFRNALVAHIGAERFDLWFGGSESVLLNGAQVTVTAPDRFSLEHLRKHFRSEVEFVARRLLGDGASVDFQTALAPALPASTPHAATDPADRTAPKSEVSLVAEPQTRGRFPESRSGSPRSVSRTTASSGGSEDAPSRIAPTEGSTESHPGEARATFRRRYATLDGFVSGPSNRLAETSVRMCVERLGAITPLFLYGPSGSGKTHLLEGVYSAALRSRQVRSLLMLSAEEFTSQFIGSLRGTGLPSFRRKYRDVELLILDDLQFFAGKKATVCELQYTLDTLLRQGRQVVLSADRPPAELLDLGPELVARLSGGLVCGIEAPDEATRLAIVARLARDRQVAVPAEVLRLIASEIHGDARHLTGALNRLVATATALSSPITLDLARESLSDLFAAARRVVRITDVEKAVCEVFGLDPASLQSNKKARTVTQPRMLAMFLARRHTRAAFSEIGEHFGRRTHSTVISAQKKVEQWLGERSAIDMPQGPMAVDEVIRRLEHHLRTA